MAQVKFVRGVSSGLPASRDLDTLYFCTDGALYLGNSLIAQTNTTNPTEVGNLISEALKNYYTKGEIDTFLTSYYTKAEVDKMHSDAEAALKKYADDAVAVEKNRAEGVESGLRSDVNAVTERMTTAEGKITNLETESAKHALKSVVDAMYTNTQIDGFIAEAKKYADDNDANTTYGIVYDSENKKIKLVEGGTEVEIDASSFVKDGMISNVTIGDDNDLVITFNTDAGQEAIVLPLDQLVDIYTGSTGSRVNVTVASDKSISAELVAGSISKNYFDENVQASLAKADSALQSHQDISHLATKNELNDVDSKFANYTTTENLTSALDLKADAQTVANMDIAYKAADLELSNRVKDLEDNKAGYATTGEVATAKQEAITAAAGDAQSKVDALANGQVKTNKEAIEAINNEETGILKQAKDYVDSLAGNYDAAGSAAAALKDAKDYVDSLAGNYDAAGSAAAALEDAKDYVDSLAGNYDAAGSAAAALEEAKTDASKKAAVVLVESQSYTDQAKSEAISEAESKIDAALAWGSFGE